MQLSTDPTLLAMSHNNSARPLAAPTLPIGRRNTGPSPGTSLEHDKGLCGLPWGTERSGVAAQTDCTIRSAADRPTDALAMQIAATETEFTAFEHQRMWNCIQKANVKLQAELKRQVAKERFEDNLKRELREIEVWEKSTMSTWTMLENVAAYEELNLPPRSAKKQKKHGESGAVLTMPSV